MPALSFNCQPDDRIYLEQVLPGLLNRTKGSTIRPLGIEKGSKEFPDYRLKTGDIVTMYWKQRTSPKDAIFWKESGAMTSAEFDKKFHFPKMLGKVMITDAFKIEMIRETQGLYGSLTMWRIRTVQYGFYFDGYKMEELAKRDSFKDSNQMFRWFDRQYDIKDSKKFIVYPWEWLDES